MKLVFASILFALSASAANGYKATIEGDVKYVQSGTIVCKAIGCPPSRKYYKFVLINAEVEGVKGPVARIQFSDLEINFNLSTVPAYFTYGGVRLKEGMRVQMTGKVQTVDLGRQVYANFHRPTEVKIVGKATKK